MISKLLAWWRRPLQQTLAEERAASPIYQGLIPRYHYTQRVPYFGRKQHRPVLRWRREGK